MCSSDLAPVAVGTDENLVLIPFTAIATACDGSSTNLSFLDPTGQLYSTNAGETDVTPSTVPGTLTVTCPGNLPIGAVTNTSPADTATNVAVTAVLDWQDTPNADTWDVYLSSFSPPLFVGTVSASTYDPPGDLTNGITYH